MSSLTDGGSDIRGARDLEKSSDDAGGGGDRRGTVPTNISYTAWSDSENT